MNTNSVKLVCFSPTGTTKTIVQSVSKGINSNNIELIDITKPRVRNTSFTTSKDELLVIGVPVYMGRVPELLSEWFSNFKADNTPTVCIVVYGNRAYENSLKELKDIVAKCGCKTIACGAYIGEHSFSSPEIPTAHNRPDTADIAHAEDFGQKVAKKLKHLFTDDEIVEVESPGSYPYMGITKLWDVDFIAVTQDCSQCGICSANCPVEAISNTDSEIIDINKCISCCSCIKICPQHARSIKNGPVADARLRLLNLYSERKQPEMYL